VLNWIKREESVMKGWSLIVTALLGLLLAGCAGSVSAPQPIQPLSTDQRSGLHISSVTADAASGVEMSDGDFDLVCQKIKAYAQTEVPGVMVDPPAGGLKMQVHFTKFDRGSAFARAMLIGLGQIRIEATVSLIDSTGKTVAQYAVAKDFALGGIAGASTTVDDVEQGFAKSVVAILKG
jgi:hypothetical protein